MASSFKIPNVKCQTFKNVNVKIPMSMSKVKNKIAISWSEYQTQCQMSKFPKDQCQMLKLQKPKVKDMQHLVYNRFKLCTKF